jgi:hypothetical protein
VVKGCIKMIIREAFLKEGYQEDYIGTGHRYFEVVDIDNNQRKRLICADSIEDAIQKLKSYGYTGLTKEITNE